MKVSNNSWEWRVFILQEKIMIMHPDILTWYSAVSQTFNISDNLDIVAHKGAWPLLSHEYSGDDIWIQGGKNHV